MPPSGPVGAIPPPPGVEPNFENPEDILHTINLVSQILSMVIMTPFIIIRVYVKIWVAPPFLPDDCKSLHLPAIRFLARDMLLDNDIC